MMTWGECIAAILLTIPGCFDWDQVYWHLTKNCGGWTKPKLSGLAYLVQVPCPHLAKITKKDLAHAIVTNLRDRNMPSANALLQLSDGQICGDCDSSGECDGSILFCDKCQEESEAHDATNDWVVVLNQITLGKTESGGEFQPSTSRPDEIGALVLLGVGLLRVSTLAGRHTNINMGAVLRDASAIHRSRAHLAPGQGTPAREHIWQHGDATPPGGPATLAVKDTKSGRLRVAECESERESECACVRVREPIEGEGAQSGRGAAGERAGLQTQYCLSNAVRRTVCNMPWF